MTDLPFVSALVQADLPVWEQCLQAEFLQKMENGTLSEDCFKSYLVEDSLYLREYAKIFAWGMTKATTMAAMRTYYSLLSFVQENEDLTRLRYLEQYGLREADIQSLPLRPESRAYLDCMIDAARTGEGEANHKGIDIGASGGAAIVAAADGTVTTAAYSSAAGNYVMIDHGGGLYTVYMHASALLVSPGQTVSAGQTIAQVGSTGISTGNHLHFGVSLNGSYVSPWSYLGR